MRIYRIAQVSSLMYHGAEKPNAVPQQPSSGVFLTPAPTIAQKEGPLVSAYQLPFDGNYLSLDFMGQIDPKICKLIQKIHGKQKNCQSALAELLNNPTDEWTKALKSIGYSGFINGDYLYVVDKRIPRYLGVFDFDNRTVRKTR